MQAVGQSTLEHGLSRSQAGAVGVALGSLFKLRAHTSARWTHQTLGRADRVSAGSHLPQTCPPCSARTFSVLPRVTCTSHWSPQALSCGRRSLETVWGGAGGSRGDGPGSPASAVSTFT